MGGKGLGPQLPRACATYRVSESGFPLLHKGATNAHVPELHVTVPDSSLKIIEIGFYSNLPRFTNVGAEAKGH